MSFASLWDCFWLFCAYKENSGKKTPGNCGFFGGLVKAFLFKTKTKEKLKLLWLGGIPQVYKPSFTKLNDWAIYSFLTLDPRGWIPRARCRLHSSRLQRFLGSTSQKQTAPLVLPLPHLLLSKCSLTVTLASCYGCGPAVCTGLWPNMNQKVQRYY